MVSCPVRFVCVYVEQRKDRMCEHDKNRPTVLHNSLLNWNCLIHGGVFTDSNEIWLQSELICAYDVEKLELPHNNMKKKMFRNLDDQNEVLDWMKLISIK